MAGFMTWIDQSGDSLLAALRSIIAYLPFLIAAALLMLIGWLLARLLKTLCVRLCRSLSGVLERLTRAPHRRPVELSPALVRLIGNVSFWVVILVFAALAARTARLEAFSVWLDRVIVYLPTLVAGGLIVLAGYLLSTLVRDVVAAALTSAGSLQHEFFGIVAQSAVFFAAIVIGLDQIGIDVTFLTTLLAVVTSGILLGLALAFGLGAREFVSNLIAAHQLQQVLKQGQAVSIDDEHGRVLEITTTHVSLLTGRGKLLVPARRFQDTNVMMPGDSPDE